MIGEFCPKVFALRGRRPFGVETIVFRSPADRSAGIVTELANIGLIHSLGGSICTSFDRQKYALFSIT